MSAWAQQVDRGTRRLRTTAALVGRLLSLSTAHGERQGGALHADLSLLAGRCQGERAGTATKCLPLGTGGLCPATVKTQSSVVKIMSTSVGHGRAEDGL